jgi:fructosamine-3-kinase
MRITKEFKRVTSGDFKKYLVIKLDNTENFVKLNQSEYISEFVTEYLGEG